MVNLIKRIVGAVTPTKNDRKVSVFYGPTKPENMKKGDIWYRTKGSQIQLFRQF